MEFFDGIRPITFYCNYNFVVRYAFYAAAKNKITQISSASGINEEKEKTKNKKRISVHFITNKNN